ncbi:alanine and proline-rich secreted protein Apa [Nonomuraea roseoviolacea]|uniref:DUF3558 domain-containing protein n=1 Tax=Nonomuraea roseoviolacea subsp. carminata TaxID=160689 RepID=A0ABT1KGX0_9ACTN|nr:alanine and proline-rich secreted protein Apa [Nonomuraea roseoviolacea]MCP2352219.1 hypothetical protein [Nonomuraea roseoviolacea subsp. carminata]
MPALEDRLHQVMADEITRLHAAPDLAERVIRSARRKRMRARIAALTGMLAVAAATPLYLTTAPAAGPAPIVAETPSPPAIDDTPAPRSTPPDFGDLGDGKAFGRVKVGYLPPRLQWAHWSQDNGDAYTTSWNYDGDRKSFYCVQIFVYEDQAVQEIDDHVRRLRDEEEGKEVTLGDRTGYALVENVGEDGTKGTPTLYLTMSERRRAQIMFSPVYAEDLGGAKAVDRELRRIAEGLTADD